MTKGQVIVRDVVVVLHVVFLFLLLMVMFLLLLRHFSDILIKKSVNHMYRPGFWGTLVYQLENTIYCMISEVKQH